MNKLNLLGVAICLVSTSAFALDQGEYRFNGFGTAAISRVGGVADSTLTRTPIPRTSGQ